MSIMHSPLGMRLLATVIAALGMGALVSGVASVPSAGAATPAPQHYLCYQAAAKSGFKVPQGIRLVNALAPNGFVPTIGPANVHCNPALKVVPGARFPITSPTWHFLGWAIAAEQPSATVTATNQFGTAMLVTKAPTELLVPSWKSLTGPPNQQPTAPPGEDHYTCYPVSYVAGAPKFSAPAPVMVRDEFGSALTTVKVGSPKTLCVPTEKILPTGLTFPINNPNLNYVCFKVSKTPVKSPVFDENQFGQGKVTVTVTQKLCVPTTLASSTG
jgi:hypothetical protein